MTNSFTQLERLQNMQEYSDAIKLMNEAIELAEEGRFFSAADALEEASVKVDTLIVERDRMQS